jgi:diketogulonate reductase-like aldo/keto reductase
MIEKTIQGEDVPGLGLGTWQLTGRQCRTGVALALALG